MVIRINERKTDWSQYTQAQTQEKQFFEQLLSSLLENIKEKPRTVGRPPLLMRDQIFCAVYKVYSQLSSRRVHGAYKECEDKTQISKAPNFNAVNKILNNSALEPVLQDLISKTAKYFINTEKIFGIDSSGFATKKMGKYLHQKYYPKMRHNWLKCHIAVGINSHAVVAVEITNERCADTRVFEPLLEKIKDQGFTIKEVLADRGYSSKKNLEMVSDAGGPPFIDFKRNATGRSKGFPTWKEMQRMKLYDAEQFHDHYRYRPQVESVFYAIKAKMGESLKSKNFVSQKNELLCKILAYNITVLIRWMFERRDANAF